MDPARARATVQQLNNAVNFLFRQNQELDQKVGGTVKQIWKNEEELKGGLDASEYNLRSHQKVLNSIAIDLESTIKAVNALAKMLAPASPELTLEHLQLASVPLPADEGQEPVVVRRINWAYYHGEVEKDLRILAEIEEKRAAEEQQKTQIQKLDAAVKAVAEKAKAGGNDPAEVEEAAKELLGRTQKLAGELGKAMKGEPYDAAVIAEAEKFIAEVEAKEGAAAPLPDKNQELPEGAAVFGG